MADVAYTADDVMLVTGETVENATCGETIAAGQVIYVCIDEDNNSFLFLVDTSSDEAPASGEVIGVALASGAVGQTIPFLKRQGDVVAFGDGTEGELVPGQVYVASSTKGNLMPAGDLGAGEYSVIVGYASDIHDLVLRPHRTGTQVEAV